MTEKFDPYNGISYLELNKKRWGRGEPERVESRYQKPAVKKIYLWKNGDDPKKKPKLYVWRQWQCPTLKTLLQEVGPFVGLETGAGAIYDINGTRIDHEDDIVERGLYFVTGYEALAPVHTKDNFGQQERYESPVDQRHTSMSAPEYTASRMSYYDDVRTGTPPRPKSSHLPRTTNKVLQPKRKDSWSRQIDEFQRYYEEATQPSHSRVGQNVDDEDDDEEDDMFGEPPRVPSRQRRRADGVRFRSRSSADNYSRKPVSDFDDGDLETKDKSALQRHKEHNPYRSASTSRAIYDRRDQTNPDVYIIYVFLNGHGMESQFLNFQKKQLEKGMNYVMELIARRFNVKPGKLCNMDGKKITSVSQLMSRGAYILVPVSQSFRDTWYFLPDNAIDTSSNRQRIEDRSAQRDRYMQRMEKRENTKKKTKKPPQKSRQGGGTKEEPFGGRNRSY